MNNESLDFSKLHANVSEILEAVAELSYFVKCIDLLLQRLDRALDRLQPNATGKIRVVFEKQKDSDIEVPVTVRYTHFQTDPYWRYSRLKRDGLSMRAKKARAFHENFEKVQYVLSCVQEVLELRTASLKAVQNFRLSVNERRRWHDSKLQATYHNMDIIDMHLDADAAGNPLPFEWINPKTRKKLK